MSPLDAITVLRTLDGRPCNKRVVRDAGGGIAKDRVPSGDYRARTVPIPDLAALREYLFREVCARADTMISFGLFVDPPAEEWLVLSQRTMAAKLGVDEDDRDALSGWHQVDGEWAVCRLKENMARSSFQLFDRDQAPGMPPDLSGLSRDEWFAALDLLVPGFAACGKLWMPSTTTRVLIDGQPMASSSGHCLVQVVDPDYIAGKIAQAALRATIATFEPVEWADPIPLAFGKPIMRDGEVSHRVWWPLFDKSVIGVERLIYNGCPVTFGNGLTVAPPQIDRLEGPRLDLSLVKDLTGPELAAVQDATSRIRGKRTTFDVKRDKVGRDGKPRISEIDEIAYVLTLDFELQSRSGKVTFGELIASGVDHVRLQSPFRDSTTEAAFYSTLGGTPFVFDMGDRTKYMLDRESLRTTTDIIKAWLVAMLRPSYATLDGRVFCERANRPLRAADVDITSALIEQLRLASNAPLLKGRGVDENKLPTHAKKWLEVAWGDIKAELPQGAATEHAAKVFKRQLLQLLNTMVSHNGRLHTIASLALDNAYLATVGEATPKKKCRWIQYEGYRIWARFLADGTPELAVQGGLSTQLSPQIKDLAEMGNDEFTAKARSYGLAKGREVENRVPVQNADQESEGNPGRGRAAVLVLAKLEDLSLSISDDCPHAEAVARILGPEPKTFRVH